MLFLDKYVIKEESFILFPSVRLASHYSTFLVQLCGMDIHIDSLCQMHQSLPSTVEGYYVSKTVLPLHGIHAS